MNAHTRASRLDRGAWKFVTRRSTTRKGQPGVRYRSVCPSRAVTKPSEEAQVSKVLTAVVPTATTRPPRSRQRSTASAVSVDNRNRSTPMG